ncbi:pentapeptide repeat-containing protein [Nonomuraea sp. PA05]|uniref:pentapeptide repeat-containing protein n=1 Tax=Nonomuraea sp. PA05 TaxID=2604466 RepID=UPI001651B180|nr:pentapeptide repeat-containing protein [Nonomuraea sp. PA05]
MENKANVAVRSSMGRKMRLGVMVLVCCAAVAAASILLFGPLTDMIASHDVQNVAKAEQPKELRIARDAARGRIVQVILGILGIGGFVYTARNFTLARQQSELNRRTLELATLQVHEQVETTRRSLTQNESAQMTDRFMRAIDQLGSEASDIRLGGIHSLERIAHDSPRDHPAVMEALTAFVRRVSKTRSEEVPQDLQAAVTTLVRRIPESDRGRLNLRGAHLNGLDLIDANLVRADLTGASLAGADLSRADLNEATLANADLSRTTLCAARMGGAKLTQAVLREADLSAAGLVKAEITDADLSDACLREADLSGTKAERARFTGADVTEASLVGAHLTGADFTGAILEDSRLGATTLNKAVLSGVRADRAVFAAAVLTDAVISAACLAGTDLSDCRLDNANLSGARLAGALMHGVDLTKAKLVGLDLTGAIATVTTCLPSGWQREPDSGLIRRIF